MEIAVLDIDLGKTTCSVAGLGDDGKVVLRKRVQRHRLLDFFLAQLAPCIVAMEACGGAHHLGHFCIERGHEPRLMSPLYVRPYVKVHKTDDILVGQFNDIIGQPFLIDPALRNLSLCRTVLTQGAAGTTLGHAKFLPHMIDTFTTTRRA